MNERIGKSRIRTMIGAGILGIVLGGCSTLAGEVDRSGDGAAIASDLAGRWEGSFHGVGTGDKQLEGRATLEIAEDGTFTLNESRPGASTAKETGTVVVDGRRVTLRTSSGATIKLDRRGNVLHGLAVHRGSGYPMHLSVERQS